MNQNLQTILTSAVTAIAGVVLATTLGLGPKTTTSIVKVPAAKSVTLAPKAANILKSDGTTVEKAFAEANEDISEIRKEATKTRHKLEKIEQVVGNMLRDGSKAVREGIIDGVEKQTKEQLTRAKTEAKEALKAAEKKAKETAKTEKEAAKTDPLHRLFTSIGVQD